MKLNCDRTPKMVIGDVNGINNLTPLQLTSNETIILGEKFNYEDMSFKEKLDITYRIANICKSELAFVDNYNKNLKAGEKPKRIQIKRRLDESGYSRFIESSTKFLDKEYVKNDITYNQRLWHVVNNNYSLQLCPVCQKKRSFNVNLNGYNDFCSRKCGINDMENRSNDIVFSRVKEDNIINYFNENKNGSIDETIELIAKWKGCEKEEIESKFKEELEKSEEESNKQKIVIFSFDETREKILSLFKGGRYSQYENRYGDLIESIKSNTEFLNEFYEDISVLQRVWHIVFNTPKIIRCQSCNKPQTFIACYKGYNNFCGSSCHQMYKRTFNGEKPKDLPVLTKHREYVPKTNIVGTIIVGRPIVESKPIENPIIESKPIVIEPIENPIIESKPIVVEPMKPEVGDYAYIWTKNKVYYGLIISNSIIPEDFIITGERKYYYTAISPIDGEIKFDKDGGIYASSKENLLKLIEIEAEKAKMEIINIAINNLNELK